MPQPPSVIRSIPAKHFFTTVSQSYSYAEIIRKLNLSDKATSHIQVIKRICQERQINLNHLKTRSELTREQMALQSAEVVKDWLANKPGFVAVSKGWQHELRVPLRDWLLNRAGYKCEECGWDKKHSETNICPVQVHHKDGDATNNRPENLRILCPNCHSLTSNFGRRNRNGKRCARYAAKT